MFARPRYAAPHRLRAFGFLVESTNDFVQIDTCAVYATDVACRAGRAAAARGHGRRGARSPSRPGRGRRRPAAFERGETELEFLECSEIS
ncbi:hypothetical protein EVAR_19378_1 [Eumeta japonica]|uniref:Uncharacterized protein n=1 Tax=Eumeta variegata TaxID=151549 RepID=A0A4C1TRH1_EUMVA|nr:hypothetical protein EVAR_19378_1 [Eumeta japonica]